MLTVSSPLFEFKATAAKETEKLARAVDVFNPDIITACKYEELEAPEGHPFIYPKAVVDWSPDTPKFWLISNKSAVKEPVHKSLLELTK